MAPTFNRNAIGFDWVEIAGGNFLIGSNPSPRNSDQFSYEDEQPQHEVELLSFWISAYPITNAQYLMFVESTGYKSPGDWPNGVPETSRLNHPVTYVDWYDAQAFAVWCGASLPTEAQWEKSARGLDSRQYPWGENVPSSVHANCGNVVGDTTPVDRYRDGASPYGVLDLAGNVWEWTTSAYAPYPYRKDDGREDVNRWGERVVRGGNYLSSDRNIRCSDRHFMFPTARDVYVGFRVVVNSKSRHSIRDGIDLNLREVPAGSFIMGNDYHVVNNHQTDIEQFKGSHHSANRAADFDNETPQHTLDLPPFRISRTPVTNRQYEFFTLATGYPVPGHWPKGLVSKALADHPVVYVDWNDAQAFCDWASVKLPTEAQWERAARWIDGRIWPWGNFPPNEDFANFGQKGKSGETSVVGSYPLGASAEGVLDLAGNVWEMVASSYRSYPYDPNDGREDLSLDEKFVLRGGSFFSPHPRYLRTSVRSMSHKTRRRDHIGFRVVVGLRPFKPSVT